MGLATGILVVSFIGYKATHAHALWTGGRVAFILIAFYGLMGIIAGLVNSSVEAGSGDGHDHGHGDHDDHAHHGSFSPIIMSAGIMIFIYGFVESYILCAAGLLITFLGVFNWWREDFPNDGKHEMKSLGKPFGGQDVRKVGLWIFLMSETMVFGSFFTELLERK